MTMKQIPMLFLLCLCAHISLSQTSNPEFKKGLKYPNNFDGFQFSFSSFLDNTVAWMDSTQYVNAVNFISFQIDTAGNVFNIRFSNNFRSEVRDKEMEGMTPELKALLNKGYDSIIRKTNGAWIPAKKNGKPVISKPLLIMVSCNHGHKDFHNPNNRGLGTYTFGELFGPGSKGEEYIFLTGIQWNENAVW